MILCIFLQRYEKKKRNARHFVFFVLFRHWGPAPQSPCYYSFFSLPFIFFESKKNETKKTLREKYVSAVL